MQGFQRTCLRYIIEIPQPQLLAPTSYMHGFDFLYETIRTGGNLSAAWQYSSNQFNINCSIHCFGSKLRSSKYLNMKQSNVTNLRLNFYLTFRFLLSTLTPLNWLSIKLTTQSDRTTLRNPICYDGSNECSISIVFTYLKMYV